MGLSAITIVFKQQHDGAQGYCSLLFVSSRNTRPSEIVTIVRKPTFILHDDLADLIPNSPHLQKQIEQRSQPALEQLRHGFKQWDGVCIPEGQDPNRIYNVQIPSPWIADYKMETYEQRISNHKFVANVHLDQDNQTLISKSARQLLLVGCLLVKKLDT